MKTTYTVIILLLIANPAIAYEVGNRSNTKELTIGIDNFSVLPCALNKSEIQTGVSDCKNHESYFNGNENYIASNQTGISFNLTNYTLLMYAFVVANNSTNMMLIGNDNTSVGIKDCDIDIIPGKTYNMTATINTSGKYVHCQEIIKDIRIVRTYDGTIDESKFYQKPLNILERVKLFIHNLMRWDNANKH